MRVQIMVTHLLGSGHLARALVLARAFQGAGHAVSLISGGMPVPHLNTDGIALVQLAPLRSDGVDFTRLLDDSGAVAGTGHYGARITQATRAVTAFQPDVLITELFPFGRRSLRDEFLAVLEVACGLRKRPLICASVRDILAPPSKPAKAAFADDLLTRFYDHVLVHSDETVTPLTLSWPASDAVSDRLIYTGFVAPPAAPPHPDRLGAGEVIVSAGGGNVGAAVFETACRAAAQDPDRRWRILVGGTGADGQIATLGTTAPANVRVEPARPDFRSMLHHAAASVSMCGYNTALDVLQSGCPAVLIPFDAGGEVEQTLRADALSKRPAIACLRDAELNADTLLAAVRRVIAQGGSTPATAGMDGAAQTVRILSTLMEKRVTA